jgi:hypothetical protein|tara:strand:- start:566 stop:898 length:333 start_codon:yes stop_codon:yes gene_type:complete
MNHKEKIKQLELYWQKHIAQFERSKSSQKAYCTKHNLVDHQLSYWKKRIHQIDGQLKVNTHFAKIKLQPEAVISKKMLRLTLNLPNGMTLNIELDSRKELVTMIQELVSV